MISIENTSHLFFDKMVPPISAESSAPMRWIATSDEARLGQDGVFLNRSWYGIVRPKAYYRVLELVTDERSVGVAAIWDLWLPGICRVWTLPQEPQIFPRGPSLGHALGGLIRLARINGVDLLESRQNAAHWPVDEVDHLLLGGSSEVSAATLVDLSSGVEMVRRQLSDEHTEALKLAEGSGLAVRYDTLPVELLELASLSDNPEKTIDYLERLLGTEGFGVIVTGIYYKRQLQSAQITPYDRHRGYLLHGFKSRDQIPGASILCHIKAMEELQKRGVIRYDITKVSPPSSAVARASDPHFRAGFGGRVVNTLSWRLPLTKRGEWLKSQGPRLKEKLSSLAQRA